MILKSLKLDNIRSYTSQQIEFPDGSVLLSGDIGSGKSSILLAIEFALFGILRAELSGSSLLRKGKTQGSVELKFDLDGKEIFIKRGLKKVKDNIQQDVGYIIVDGVKIEGSPVELKTRILDLLGYPKELVTKSKSLVYRYTVYTPQEQMKQILVDEKEHRIDTLRKVFGIDKYKRISENTSVITKSIREKKTSLAGRTADIEEKKKQKLDLSSKLLKAGDARSALKPKIETSRKEIDAIKQQISKEEEKVKSLNEIKKKLEIIDVKIKEKVDSREKNNSSVLLLEKEITSLKEKISSIAIQKTYDEKELEKQIKADEEQIREMSDRQSSLKEKHFQLSRQKNELEKEISEKSAKTKDLSAKKERYKELSSSLSQKDSVLKEFEKLQKEVQEVMLEIRKHETIKSQSESLKNKISSIDKCPTCLQLISKGHKSAINLTEDQIITKSEGVVKEISQIKEDKENKLKELKRSIDSSAEKEREADRLKIEIANIENIGNELQKKQKDLASLNDQFASAAKELENIDDRKIESSRKDLEEKRSLAKRLKEKETLLQSFAEKDRRKKDLDNEQASIKDEIGKLNGEKIEARKRYEELKDIEQAYAKTRSELDKLLSSERELSIQYASLTKEYESLSDNISLLDKEVNEKLMFVEQIRHLSQLQNWLEEYFTNLMGTMEKHVMARVHSEFNEVFQKWFSILVDDQNINVRLDDEFTPIIEQNGYETELESLSGGERTALSLAYRLSLNKVINDIICTIRTKDILILDEPTDGFSAEQLDKIRDVLEELNTKQVIIVSHENKIEGFVDKIIRISKTEHNRNVNYV